MQSSPSRPFLSIDGDDASRLAIETTLERFGPDALACAKRAGIAVVALARAERYVARSASLRRLGVDVDGWPVPPAGLFVVEEKTVYLRSATPMTVAHEFGHALDCALGGGIYRSGFDPEVRAAFAGARSFVTPYAGTGLDEYVAECLRAYVEVNDASSPWPKATRARLRSVDPQIFLWCERLFAAEFAEAARATTCCLPSETEALFAGGPAPRPLVEAAVKPHAQPMPRSRKRRDATSPNRRGSAPGRAE